MSGAIPQLPQYSSMARCSVKAQGTLKLILELRLNLSHLLRWLGEPGQETARCLAESVNSYKTTVLFLRQGVPTLVYDEEQW
jgi:hypothetical protein